jgi:hypothetical protein
MIAFEPVEYNYRLVAGTTFQDSFTLKVDGVLWNLTSHHARLQARHAPTDVIPTIDLNDVDGEIVLGGVAGTVTITEIVANTRGWPLGGIPYQLELEDGAGAVQCLQYGTITTLPEVCL